MDVFLISRPSEYEHEINCMLFLRTKSFQVLMLKKISYQFYLGLVFPSEFEEINVRQGSKFNQINQIIRP